MTGVAEASPVLGVDGSDGDFVVDAGGVRPVVHDAGEVVGDAVKVYFIRWRFVEVIGFLRVNVIPHHLDVIVSVWSALLVVEANGVADLV